MIRELSSVELTLLQHNYQWHQPREGQSETYDEVREAYFTLALLISQTQSPGRELSLALTNLEQSRFWTNAGIARRTS